MAVNCSTEDQQEEKEKEEMLPLPSGGGEFGGRPFDQIQSKHFQLAKEGEVLCIMYYSSLL